MSNPAVGRLLNPRLETRLLQLDQADVVNARSMPVGPGFGLMFQVARVSAKIEVLCANMWHKT
jgi:hypothetical protein